MILESAARHTKTCWRNLLQHCRVVNTLF